MSHVPYELLQTKYEKGLVFLSDEFGIRPRVGWQVNSFSDSLLDDHKKTKQALALSEQEFVKEDRDSSAHPSSYARLFAELGLDAMLIDDAPGTSFIWRP